VEKEKARVRKKKRKSAERFSLYPHTTEEVLRTLLTKPPKDTKS
jgi:hypothetical protein